MSSSKDEHGEMTAEHILDCENLKAKIKTNDKLNSYVKMTIKCDVKCSLAQQYTYKRLMEPAQKDEFGYGVGDWTLLDSYWARARRIAATYARFFLEKEDGCKSCKDKDGNIIDLTGRFYWMGLGAFAVKTVLCMFDKWQIKYVCVGLEDFTLNTVYEGLGKGNFWLFQDVGGWHYLYLLSNTTTPDKDGNYIGYKNSFIPCRDIRSVDILCEVPKDIVQNRLPWAEDLEKIGNLALPTRLTGVLERSMELVNEIEQAMIQKKKIKFIQKLQFLQVAELAKHEQGNILQPMIYLDEFTPPSDDISGEPSQDMSLRTPSSNVTGNENEAGSNIKIPSIQHETKDVHATKIPRPYSVAEEFDRKYVYSQKDSEVVMQDWLQVMRQAPISWFMPTVKVDISAACHDELFAHDIPDMLREATNAIGLTEADPLSHTNTTLKPEAGGGIKLYDYDERMIWINEAAKLCHKLYMKYPEYVIGELETIAGWVETADQFEDIHAATKLY